MILNADGIANLTATEPPPISVNEEFGDLIASCGRWQAKLRDSGVAYSLALCTPGSAVAYLEAKDIVSRASIRTKVFAESGEFLDDFDLNELLGYKHGKIWRRGILPRMLDALREEMY